METATKTFEEVKAFILQKGEDLDWCEGQAERTDQSQNMEDLINIIKDNISWISYRVEGLADILEGLFGKELLFSNNIYTSGHHNIEINSPTYLITLGSSSATVKTLGSSSAMVETWDSSSATVKTLDSSSATVKTLGSSSATVETLGSSSKLTYSLGDGQCPSIKHLTEKKLFVKTSDFEIVQVQ
ncbi:hypothetical protein [Chitinophaga sp. sic0106]|uniref:hypothetical protein n=1 Tax=Chitinophaga sp. sic0106 TaxID=2854785 RepID=UPI001C442ABB|nr:hypothetical protein [Chitinophaga sp. sic0106]MBV7531321.1 hypothetical protein [Chitinophaga sp. sic0106]